MHEWYARGMLSISFDFGIENVPHRRGSQNLVKSSSPKLDEIEINICIFYCSQSTWQIHKSWFLITTAA